MSSEKDKRARETIEARNKLETYAYSLKTQIEDSEKLADKVSAEEKETLQKSIRDVLDWMEEVNTYMMCFVWRLLDRTEC